MDYLGNIDTHYYYIVEGQTLTGFEKNMRILSMDSIIFLGSISTEIPFRPWFVRLNTEGEILESIVFSNVQGDSTDYVVGANWILDSVYTYITYGFLFNNLITAVAIDKYEGSKLIIQKAILFGNANWHESLLAIEDKWILGVRHMKNIPNPDGPDKRHYQVGLHSIDKNMNVKAEWISPPDSAYFAAYDILRVDDNEYVIATIKRVAHPIHKNPFRPWLIRVNSFTNKVLWDIDLSLDTVSVENESRKLLFNLDTTAIYIAGKQFEIGILNMRPPQVHGFLAKVTMEGELQWIRRYLGTEGSKFPDHKIFDTELLPDGSIIMVGESTDLFVDEPPGQRGWILRVDSFGCLVPGCHLVSVEAPSAQADLDIRVYPNPATHGQVWVYVADDRLAGRLRFSLFDMQGRAVHQWHQEHFPRSTYLLDLPAGLGAGAYLLRLEDNHGHSWQEKLQVAR